MKTKIGRYFIASMWILAGFGKIFAVLAEVISQKTMISSVMEKLAEETNWGFYRQICENYYIPYSLLFIFMAASIEIISGLLILKGKVFARLGLLGVSFVLLTYLPFHHRGALIGMLILLTGQIYLMIQKNEENLLQGIVKRLKKSK